MKRIVEPEILDVLPVENPEAQASRRDLQRVNAWMGNAEILHKALLDFFPSPPKKMVELGAGDGTLLLKIAKKMPSNWRGVELTFVDQQNVVSEKTLREFAGLGWTIKIETADIFDWSQRAETVDCVLGNLFFHHFQRDQLARLFGQIAERTNVFLACEPRRSFSSKIGCRLLWFIGCNRVTRHDAIVSVNAGFNGQELSELWPRSENWKLTEQNAGFASHLFAAQKIRRDQ